MHLPERGYSPVAEILTVAVAVADEEMDFRSTNAQTAKSTIIPPKCAERKSMLKTTQQPAIQTQTTNEHATTAVCQDTVRETASTSNEPGINATE
jgi:hypothetical protein